MDLIRDAFDLLEPYVCDARSVVRVDGSTLFFDDGKHIRLDPSCYTVESNSVKPPPYRLARMRVYRWVDGLLELIVFDDEDHIVLIVRCAAPLPGVVRDIVHELAGSTVDGVTAAGGGLCMHLADGGYAVLGGTPLVFVDSQRVPFTVGDVSVEDEGGFHHLCFYALASDVDGIDEDEPVVVVSLHRGGLEEVSFNVI